MMERIALALFLVTAFVSYSFAGPLIKYEGSSTVGLFMKDAAKVYKKANLEISVITESNGGEICALAKTCDIGGVARDIHPLFEDRGLFAIPFAYDVLTAIVNSENPVKGLTSAQLRGIFSGKIKNWKEVGGPAQPITVYIVGKESATRDVFRMHILKESEYGKEAKVIRPDWKVVLNTTLDKGGIGQISYSFAATTDQVRPLIIDGQDPKDYKSAYPIRRLLYLTTFGLPQGHVKDFIDWATSDEGRKIQAKRFLPIRP